MLVTRDKESVSTKLAASIDVLMRQSRLPIPVVQREELKTVLRDIQQLLETSRSFSISPSLQAIIDRYVTGVHANVFNLKNSSGRYLWLIGYGRTVRDGLRKEVKQWNRHFPDPTKPDPELDHSVMELINSVVAYQTRTVWDDALDPTIREMTERVVDRIANHDQQEPLSNKVKSGLEELKEGLNLSLSFPPIYIPKHEVAYRLLSVYRQL